MAVVLALALVAAACADDSNGEEDAADLTPTPTDLANSTTTAPRATPPTTALEPPPSTVVEVVSTTSTTEPPVSTGTAPPPPPENPRCRAGTAERELLIEFDALPDPAAISKIRVYVSVDGGPFITNGEFGIDQIGTDTDRWAVPARRLPANVPLRLSATSFNLLGQESGWYPRQGIYTGVGEPCGQPLPPPACTAGCDEQEGEQG